MKFFKKIWPYVFNKYFLTSLVFLVFLFFFDTNNLLTQIRLSMELNKLEKTREFYLKEIEQDLKDTESLMTNQKNLEKFAREKYYMKRPNEDIFVIVREGSKGKD